MVDKALLSYIKRYMQQGYDINSIRSHLLKYYPSKKVDETIHAVYYPEVKHVVHLSPALIIIAMIALGLVATGIFLSMPKTTAPPTKLLDLKTSLLATSVKAGESLNFNIELANIGTAKGFDVFLAYNIYNNEDSLVTSKEETIGVITAVSQKADIKIPENAKDGAYRLSIIARYGSKTATAKQPFSVYKEQKPVETCFDGIQNRDEEGTDCGGAYCNPCEIEETCNDQTQNQGEEGIDCGGPCSACIAIPTCSDGIKNQGEEKTDCGGPCQKCPEIPSDTTLLDAIEEIKEIAKTDKSRALSLCSEFAFENYRLECAYNVAVAASDPSVCANIEDNRTRDKCYSKVAEVTANNGLCDSIGEESRKDSCYMHFVKEGDYTVCERILHKYLRQSCEALRDIQGN